MPRSCRSARATSRQPPEASEAYVAAASYASAMLTSRLLVVYAIAILSSASLMIGTVMLKGVFNRPTAYLGIATGILGIVAIGGFGVAIILNAVCATI